MKTTVEGVYEYITDVHNNPVEQLCPVCKEGMGLMPGTRDAVCHNCGYKDPCCE
jgi:hypothetical protein